MNWRWRSSTCLPATTTISCLQSTLELHIQIPTENIDVMLYFSERWFTRNRGAHASCGYDRSSGGEDEYNDARSREVCACTTGASSSSSGAGNNERCQSRAGPTRFRQTELKKVNQRTLQWYSMCLCNYNRWPSITKRTILLPIYPVLL